MSKHIFFVYILLVFFGSVFAFYGVLQKPLGMHWDVECYHLFDQNSSIINATANHMLDFLQQLKAIVKPSGLKITISTDA